MECEICGKEGAKLYEDIDETDTRTGNVWALCKECARG